MQKHFSYIVNNIYLNSLVSIIILLILGVTDWLTGYELSFQFFYFIPLTIISYNIKFKRFFLIFFAMITAIIWFIADYFANHLYANEFLYFWNTFSRFVIFVAYSLLINSIIKNRTKLNLLNIESTKKNFLVAESIKYAKTIQDSIIPRFSLFNNIFPNSFIFNKPKDILSGDFFWYYKIENNVLFALVDCTGHGIPGSLLSVIGNILLEKIIIDKKIYDTENILNILHEEFVRAFSIGTENIDDGMEISLIKFDKTNNEIQISQTSQNIILLKNNGDLINFETNGFTIGGKLAKRKDSIYTSQSLIVEKGSWLYLFSDGYIDQFGSDENIKFGIENFNNLLKNSSKLTTSEQFSILTETLNKWKASTKQTDDITLVGIEF